MTTYFRHAGEDHSGASSTSDHSMMSMSMTSGSATSIETGMSGMSGMGDSSDSSGHVGMNMYFTTSYLRYPVIFENLKASNGGAAFGIFCVLFFAAFFLKGLFFLSAYLEQKVFHNVQNSVIIQEVDNCACDDDSDPEKVLKEKTKDPHVLRKIFFPSVGELGKDFIRLIIAFVSAMFGYALMLAVMSYSLIYFFAVVLGIAFGEVFFNRVGIVLGTNKNSALCGDLH